MLPTPTYRTQLPPIIRRELDQFSAIIGELWTTEHGTDGTHKAITSPSVTVVQSDQYSTTTGQVILQDANGRQSRLQRTVADGLKLTFEAGTAVAGSAIGTVQIDSYVSLGDSPGGMGTLTGVVQFNPDGAGTAGDEKWLAASGSDAYDAFWSVGCVGNSDHGLKLYLVGANYELSPDAGSGNEHRLGNHLYSANRWDEIAGKDGWFSGTLTLANTGLHLEDTNASHDLIVAPGSDLTADRTLTLTTGDADRTLTISGNATLNDWFDQSVKTTASPTFQLVGLEDTGNDHYLSLYSGEDLTANRTVTFDVVDTSRTLMLGGKSYSPSWTSTGTAPAIGNGTLSGAYQQIGQLVWFRVYWKAGSTTTFGTGTYSFSLPLTAGGTGWLTGSASMYDNTLTDMWVGVAQIATTTTIKVYENRNTASGIGQTVPFTWAQDDIIQVSGFYLV